MKRALAVMLLVGAAVTLTGASCNVQKEYVSADEKTYNAVAPQYLELVEQAKKADGSPRYTQEEKERFRRTTETWLLRIQKAKAR